LNGQDIHIEDLGSSNGTLVNGEKVERNVLRDGDKIRLGETTILKFTFHDRLDESFVQKMYEAALRDPLTKAFNKKYLIDQLGQEISYARRHRTKLSFILFDLDHFKRVNDTHGHLACDRVLAQLGQLALSLLRAEDVFARYGGEEFGIVARAISLEQAGLLAERLRARVESTPFDIGGSHLRLTLSLGVAMWSPQMNTPTDLIEAADAALYDAKRSGRNRYVLR
jgi:diguanylate cyclase (GGDEF)-like protein